MRNGHLAVVSCLLVALSFSSGCANCSRDKSDEPEAVAQKPPPNQGILRYGQKIRLNPMLLIDGGQKLDAAADAIAIDAAAP